MGSLCFVLMDGEVQSIDGHQSMHSAHSEHHYIPLATGRWHFCLQVMAPELPSWLHVIHNVILFTLGGKL